LIRSVSYTQPLAPSASFHFPHGIQPSRCHVLSGIWWMDGWMDEWIDWVAGTCRRTVRNNRLVPVSTWYRISGINCEVAGLPSASLGVDPCECNGSQVTAGSVRQEVYVVCILCKHFPHPVCLFSIISDCTGNILKCAVVFRWR